MFRQLKLKSFSKVAVAFAIYLLAGTTHASAAVEHVIHISVDGLRGDFLKTRVETLPHLYPNFKRLVDEGASTYNVRTDYTHTNTLPNHTSMITGRPVSRPSGAPVTIHHGYTNNVDPAPSDTLHNDGNPNLSYVASVFDVAHDNGLSTALYSGKSKFSIYNQSYTSTTGAVDVTGVDNGRDKIDRFVVDDDSQDVFLAEMAVNRFNYTFLHFDDPDDAGHSVGWGTPTWDAAVQFVDNGLGQIMHFVQNDPLLANNTAIVLSADHGGNGTTHSTANLASNYTIPFMVWGPGVSPGTDLYQLNPTTRTNPGTGRPDYNVAGQPIRNGDTGNLALALLGLGPIPGSSINFAQNLSVASPYAADFNGDLKVDGDDLTIWQQGYGSIAISAPSIRGDADGDLDVDGADFLIWQREFNATAGAPQLRAVPEPTALAMFGVGLLTTAFVRRTT